VADLNAGEWQEHARFPGIYMQALLDTTDNPRHRHTKQLETVWVIRGNAILTLDQTEVSLRDGQVIAIPIGLEHALRNEGPALVELLTFFTPPLA